MPRLFFKRFAVKRDELERRWYLRPFRRLLEDPRLLHISRRSVLPAVAIGLFIAWLPLPGHFVFAALLALVFRANVVISALTTFVMNPLTMAPILYTSYRVGRAALALPADSLPAELTWSWLFQSIERIWQPLLLGSCLMGAASAAVGYVTLNLIWRASVAAALRTRKRRKHTR